MKADFNFTIDKLTYEGFEGACEAAIQCVGRGTKKATIQACREIRRDSMAQVPVDSGTLMKSCDWIVNRRTDTSKNTWAYKGKVFYGGGVESSVNPNGVPVSSYMLDEHENLSYNHKYGRKAKFLEDPVREYGDRQLEKVVYKYAKEAIEEVNRGLYKGGGSINQDLLDEYTLESEGEGIYGVGTSTSMYTKGQAYTDINAERENIAERAKFLRRNDSKKTRKEWENSTSEYRYDEKKSFNKNYYNREDPYKNLTESERYHKLTDNISAYHAGSQYYMDHYRASAQYYREKDALAKLAETSSEAKEAYAKKYAKKTKYRESAYKIITDYQLRQYEYASTRERMRKHLKKVHDEKYNW